MQILRTGILFVFIHLFCVSAKALIVANNRTGVFVLANAISPNGDNKNDYLHIINLLEIQNAGGLQSFDIHVFNRWGQEVFQSNDLNFKWGDNAVNGVYYYVIEAKNTAGQKLTGRGDVSVIY